MYGLGYLIRGREGGSMEIGISPYSTRTLRALAETLKLHKAFLWADPEAQAFRVRSLSSLPASVLTDSPDVTATEGKQEVV